MNPWRYPQEKSKSIQRILVLRYGKLRERLVRTSISGDLLILLNYEDYPDDEEVKKALEELLELLPDKAWTKEIGWADYRLIKKIAERLYEFILLINRRYWEYEIEKVRIQ